MKKIFTLCLVLCMSYLSMGATNLKHEFRATWLTTAWGNDWPKTKVTNDATRKQQQDSLIAIFDRLQAGNMNAVCLQVRGRSDAFYQSSYEPWAAELAGARGTNPGYDPLAFAIKEAHKRGLELHAWVNPFRVTSAGTLDANDLVKKNAGQWIIQYNNGSFTGEIIDPGYPEAREYVLNVLMEIINNYDIDGIVMDDYFYPYGGTTTEDAASKALHKPANVVDVNQDGDTDDDWRRSNVDVFLEELYDRIQTKKPWVRFGMGTFGIWTTQSKVAQAYGISLPSGISGLDDYDEQACNPVEWVKNGYVDYINPQLYWPTTSTGQNYNKLCQWWAKDVCEHFSNQLINGKKVHFFSSQSISSNSAVSEIQAEIDANRSNLSSGYTGSVFFDTDAYLTMDKDLMTSRFATNALTPPMDWKSKTALSAPTNLTISGTTLIWKHATAERFTVYVYPKGTAWSTAKNDPAYLQGVIYGNSLDISGIDTNMNDIAVCAYDRFGVEHETAIYGATPGDVTPPASGTITYELNGGVQSEWETPQDMYNELNAIWNAFSGSTSTWGELETLKANVAQGIPTLAGGMALTFIADENFKAKFEWLVTYMDAKCAEQGQTLPSSNASYLRYNLQAFFIDGVRAGWPKSADYTTCGVSTLEAYQPYWKSSFANPTEPTAEVTLYAPYKEGATFDGWYAAADFSGEKVTKIDANTTGTLYAKWVEYIPTIAEVKALADDVVTNVSGVVNHIQGKNVYIQDATGGILVYTSEYPTCKVGDKIVAKGVKTIYAGAPEVKNAVINTTEASTLAQSQTFEGLSELVADMKHFATRVTVPGLKIVSYDGYNIPTVTDGVNEALCYRMSLDPAQFPIGSKITITAVAGWYNGFQFVGDVAGIELVVVGKKDQYEYPVRNSGTSSYTLINDWVISNNEDNFAANAPGKTDYVRGMAVKDGIMYFINRDTKSIVPVVGATAEMLDPIAITGEHLFERIGENGEWESACTLPFNDIKFDQAGNCLIGSCVSGDGTFQIYLVDLETGAATLVVEERLYDNPDFLDNGYRFDAFGVAGDVTQNGVIMAADATSPSWNVYRWLITDGEVAPAEQITMLLDPEYDQSLFINAAGWGTAPQIFPQDEIGSLFYVDGFNMLPMLFDEGGMLVDDFINCPTQNKVTNKDGDVLSMNYAHNGLVEFQVGDEYFLLMAAGNIAAAVPSSFALFKFADEGRTFDGLEPLWYFPANGMGTSTNGCRTAPVSVEVEGNKAHLYLYTNNNGYARYTLNVGDATSINGVTYELNGGVTNDYGWQSKADMWEAFKIDAGITTLASLDDLKAAGEGSLNTICTPLGTSQCQAILDTAKWDWLEAYIMNHQNADAGATKLTEGVSSAGWRYALAAFFLESQRTGWPKSADFSKAGKDEAYIPTWRHAFDNPTNPTEEFILNAPYREGYTFAGWYTTPDFSGEKVTTINAETEGTLYAKWVEYIPTIAEVRALADNTKTKVAGVVNFISVTNMYIQDATGGILVSTNDTIDYSVGDRIVAEGVRFTYAGAPEVKNAVIESAETDTLYDATTFETLTPLISDSIDHKYFATRVTVPGLKIVSYDGYNNPTVTDGVNQALCYRMPLDPAQFPIGSKITITAVAGWYNGFQFVGDVAGIELVVVGKKDQYEYPVRNSGTSSYTLINDWVISNNEDNFAANAPGKTDYVRGMAVKDGIMYFINRDTKSIVPVVGATAEMLDPIAITGEHLFERIGENGEWESACTLPFNDIKFDQAGNCLIGSCVSGDGTFQIYLVDLETGAATLVVEERLYDNPDFLDNGYRFDAFGVAGDVTQNGVIMAADATSPSWNVYRWLITDGEVAPAEQITMLLDPEYDQSLFINAAGWGTAPQIFPQDEIGSLFYVDGFNMLPMLFDEGGMLVDDFINCPTQNKVTNKDGDVLSMNYAHNGLVEFQVGDEYFLLMAAGNIAAAVPSSFALFKFADEGRTFDGLEPLWYFPANGMGTSTNGCRTAPVSVEVEGNKAHLYLYTNNNGYARYTLNVGDATSINGVTYELNGGVTNDYGWQSKADMWEAFKIDAGITTLASLDDLKAAGEGSLNTICTPLGTSQCQAILDTAKWDWLEAYIMNHQNADAGATKLTEGVSSAGWRYALAAFFLESQRTGWPKSADFSKAGKDEAYIPTWRHAFDNPTNPTEEFILNAPYREGYTFAGWYTTPDFSGEKVTTINAETEGTLYAKWIDETWQITYTSTDGNIVTPYKTNVFGANIVSNIYENGVGTITFDGPVTSIGDYAFDGCSNLVSITIPNSVTSLEDWAFNKCTSLTAIFVPNSVITIGESAFNGCLGLTSITIPNSVTTIGEAVFWGCKSLTSITIPNSVTNIGVSVFNSCSSLTSIVVEGGNTTYDSRNNCNAIIETSTNTIINACQNTIIPNSVTSIGNHAFFGCSGLTSITIPNSVMSIGMGAFLGCSGLTSIIIPNGVTSIEYSAFNSCSSLTSITIPNSVTSIRAFAFKGCAALTSISLPNTITIIGYQAFASCSSLSSITIPNSVTSISYLAFVDCSSIDTIYVEATTPPSLADSTVFMNTPSPTCYIPCGTLAAYEASDWASQVGEFVEEGCAPIQMCGDDLYWEYADGVLTITGTGDMYDYAADTDVPWYDVRGNIKTVNLPDAMTKIGQNAFYKCTAMTSINMPTSLTAIGEKAFAQDTKLACEIILPASMTNIASRAFFNCQAVTAFHLEATTPPTIPNDAFERTTAPIHVPCGYGHSYGKHAQWGMLNLEMCEVLQDNVYYYPIDGHTARAVTYHSNPTDTIVIPSAVVIDGMPRTVIGVAASAFADCKDIPAIIFNEGLEYIGERAFVRCYGLQGTIVLPATLETIGERAFSYCDNVEKYLIQAMTPPALGANAFTGDNKNALFYISCEAMDDYKVATNWSSLKSRLRDACLNIYHYNTPLGTNGVYTTEDTLVASIYYRRQFTPYRWETLYLPFEVDRVTVLEDGEEFDLRPWNIITGGDYYLAKPDGMLNLEILFDFTDELESHTPYIIQFVYDYYHDKIITFYGKESWNKLSTSFEVLSSSAWMQIAGNTTMQDQLLEKPVYMLRSGLDFILQKTTTTLHPFECYVMPYTAQSGAPARMNVRMRDDVATAVESVKGNESRLAYTINDHTLTVYPQGQAFSIYSLNGALIYSCEAGKETVDCELNSGCYLLHAGTEAHKIML